VDTKITLLAAVFSVAVDDGKLPTNPAARIRIPKSDTKAKRLPFSQSDLKTLLNSSIYTANFRPKGGKGEAAVWLPVLSLFSGNREEELGQLRVDDVRCQGGIWHLNILEDDDEQGAATKVKNKASWRKLPLHSAVIEAGFLRYVERIKAAGHVRLFPELTPDKYNVLTSRWSKWFHRYLRITLGIINRKKVFHSLRHNFRDACRDGGVDEEMADRLMGHKGSGDATGRGYGRGFSLEKLKEAMDKINYSGLEIPIIETEPEG
jgi:integrase